MQFLVTAYDGTDPEASTRRAAAESAHRELGYAMIKSGNILFSTAILDDQSQATIGSCRVVQFDSRAELDQWLEAEPYVKAKVWNDVQIHPCRMGPAFEWITLEPGGIRMTDGGNSDN